MASLLSIRRGSVPPSYTHPHTASQSTKHKNHSNIPTIIRETNYLNPLRHYPLDNIRLQSKSSHQSINMHSTIVLSCLAGFAAAAPQPIANLSSLFKRGSCAAQPDGYGPKTNKPDTAAAFLANHVYSNAAENAKTPSGYQRSFVSLQGATSTSNYLTYYDLKSYDPSACQAKCDAVTGCKAFNLYFERDPCRPGHHQLPEPPLLHKCEMQPLGHHHHFSVRHECRPIPRRISGRDRRLQRLQQTPNPTPRSTWLQRPSSPLWRHHSQRPARSLHLHRREIPSRHVPKHDLLRHRVHRQHSLRPCSP